VWVVDRGATGCGLSAISASNSDTDIIFHIRQYSYPYPKVKCAYGYDKSTIISVPDPISEDWVLDNDIRMEETILH